MTALAGYVRQIRASEIRNGGNMEQGLLRVVLLVRIRTIAVRGGGGADAAAPQ